MNRRWLVGAVLVVGGAIVLVAVLFWRRDTTTVIDATEARAAATSTEAPPSAAPATGGTAGVMYVYETTGYEEIDALAGARHDYPSETFLTVQQEGCGEVFRWQAIEERWITWEVCDRQALEVSVVESFHRWFGVDDAQRYECTPPASYLPPSPGAETWTFTCQASARTEETAAEVVGEETIVIGGGEVDALRVRFTSTLTGESTGGSVIDRWFGDDGLLLKEVSSTASASRSAIGTVNYTEEYAITLRSLEALTP